MIPQNYSFHVTDSDWADARRALFTEDGHENAGVFLCGLSSQQAGARLLAREFVPVPFHHYTERKTYHLEVSAQFYNDIVTRCEKTGLHPVIIHSHPMSAAAWYSQSDDYGEARLLPTLQSLLPGKAVASLVVTWDAATGRRYVDGRFLTLDYIRILGSAIVTEDLTRQDDRPSDVDETYDRQVRAIGEARQRQLSALKVAVIGVGGTGSIILEQVARVGVQHIVIVDDDVLDASNLSRIIGSKTTDVGLPKVELLADHVRTFARARISGVKDSALKQSVLSELRDCDLVFGCVDNDRTRAALNRFSYQYFIPVIDLGVRLDARSGKVTAAAGRVSIVGTGMTCLRCSHHINAERIRAESLPTEERAQLAKEGYIIGVEDAAPAVISLNTVVAGLAGTAFLNLFTGITGGIQPATQIYDATSGVVFPTTQVHESGCDVCDPSVGVKGLGDAQIVSAY